MNKLTRLHWPLIIGLGALALIRPLLNIVGLMDLLGRPFGPIIITVLISAIWVAVTLLTHIQSPLLTLTFTGICYGVFALVLGTTLSPILDGAPAGALINPVVIASVLITNAIWGGIVGLIAVAIQALTRRTRQ